MPTEDRFAEQRRSLKARVSRLEDEHLQLEMAKMRRLALLHERPGAASQSSVAAVQDMDSLAAKMGDAEAACQNAERQATEKEDQLATLRSEVQEWQRLETPEGRRLVAEVKCLREQLQVNSDEGKAMSHRTREAEEAALRTSRSASALRSDCGILRGTREALLLEDVSLRERLGAVNRAFLQSSSAVAELREAYARSLQPTLDEVQDAIRLADAAEAESEAINARLSQSVFMLSTTSRTVTELQQSFSELDGSHSDLQRSIGPSREVQRQQLMLDEEECENASSAKAQRRARLGTAATALQRLRTAYATRLEKLKETAATLSVENEHTSRNCERLRVVIAEMYSHAEVLACQLETDRKRHGELTREVAAIFEATNEVKQQAARRSRSGRVGQENADPASSLAVKATSTSGPGRRRSL